MVSYQRVIPRDLFNESDLLKCYGRLYILTEGNRRARFTKEYTRSFLVVQRESDGFLFIENLPFRIGLYDYYLTRPLNSREPWPLYAERIGDPEWEAVAVFDSEGNLTNEMKGLIDP